MTRFYKDSDFLTRLISDLFATGERGNSGTERCADGVKRRGLGSLSEINETVIDMRGKALVSLFREAVGLPPSCKPVEVLAA